MTIFDSNLEKKKIWEQLLTFALSRCSVTFGSDRVATLWRSVQGAGEEGGKSILRVSVCLFAASNACSLFFSSHRQQ